MDSSTHQNNMQFDKFYRDVSRFTTNSILAIIGLLFIAISSVFLLVSYWCLTGSEYIETFKRDYERQYDYVNIQETLIGFMKASKDKIYYYLNMFYEHNLCINEEQMEDDSSDTESDIEEEYEPSDSDVEDITEKTLLEKEMNKIIVDLSSEETIVLGREPLNELGANVMEDIMAEMKNPEFIEKKECIEENADVENADVENDDTEYADVEDADAEDADAEDVENDDTEDAVDGDTDAENDDTEEDDVENDDTENADTENAADGDADTENAADGDADAENDDEEKTEVIYYEPSERTLRSTKKKRGN